MVVRVRFWSTGSTMRDPVLRTDEFVEEVLVAAVMSSDAVDFARALSGQRGDEVAEAAAQIGNVDAGALGSVGPRSRPRVLVVPPSEPAGSAAEAFAVELDLRTHVTAERR